VEIDVVIDGLRTHLADIGEGPPVVCVHGGLGSDHHAFRPWFDRLADEFRLLMVDLQGNGLSEDPPDWESVGLHTWAAQLDGLRRALGYERWVVIGHSFGGIVAQAYAIAHQDDLDGLVIVTSGPAVDEFEERWELAQRHGTPEQAALIESGLLRHMESDAEFERVWGLVAPVYWVDKSWLPQMQRRSRFSSRAFNKAVEILEGLDLRPQLPSLRVPTLSIGGTEDWSFPPSVGPRVIADLVPGAEYAEFEHSSHFPFVEEGDAFFAVLRDFLRRVTHA
jgi:proline iminopeptidase